MCFLKQVIFDRKVYKTQRDSSVPLHVSPKNPISEEKKKITSTKIKISPPKKNSWVICAIKKLNIYVFESLTWKISSNWFFQRNVCFKLERAQTSIHCFRVKKKGPHFHLIFILRNFTNQVEDKNLLDQQLMIVTPQSVHSVVNWDWMCITILEGDFTSI